MPTLPTGETVSGSRSDRRAAANEIFAPHKPGRACRTVNVGLGIIACLITPDNEVAELARESGQARRAELVAGRSPVPHPLHWDSGMRTLFQWLPFDVDLPVLAEPPSSLHRRLADAGVALGPER
jgi:hypothetical protein